MSTLILWINLLFRWGHGWLRVRMLFIFSMCKRWAFPFLPFFLWLLGRSLGLRLLFLSLSNCESIWLRVSIDSCWARIISSCFFWTWACCSKRLTISSGVPVIYTKDSSSTEELRPMISWWQSVPRLLQCPGLERYSPLGQLHQPECGYTGTLLLARCQTHRSWLSASFP